MTRVDYSIDKTPSANITSSTKQCTSPVSSLKPRISPNITSFFKQLNETNPSRVFFKHELTERFHATQGTPHFSSNDGDTRWLYVQVIYDTMAL